MTKVVHIRTHANIALIKYWGKRDEKLFLPTKSSVAVNVQELSTTTSMSLKNETVDEVSLEGSSDKKLIEPIIEFLNKARGHLGITTRFSVTSRNHFPTASGLASSASGFSALALGISSLCNLDLSKQEISILARLGSGSASRSVYGGWVLWHRGTLASGSDSFAEQIASSDWWPELRIVVITTTREKKTTPSRTGMQESMNSSSLYPAWIARSEDRLQNLLVALKEKDLGRLGSLTEEEWLDMHDVMLSTHPSLNYWSETSYSIMRQIKKLRITNGLPIFITTDAGPHVKVICLADSVPLIREVLKPVPGIIDIIESRVAGDPEIHSIDE